VWQAELLDLSRSNVYYLPRPVSQGDLWLMRRIDELHMTPDGAYFRKLEMKAQHEVGSCHHRVH
jgi:putative transposase